jgi:predicted alpha/beta hydrolase
VALAAKRCYGIEQDKNPFHYFGWIPRYLELFAKAKETRRKMQFLQTPCVAYQSSKDELVSHKSAQRLAKNERISVVELSNSGHYYYAPNDFAFLLSEFESLIGQIK